MTVREEIIIQLKKILKDLGIEGVEPQIDVPTEEGHGDYASNIAMAIFSNSEFRIQNSEFKTPMELAQEIAKKLNSSISTLPNIEKVEAVKPGFINFWLAKDYMVKWLNSYIAKGDHAAMSSHATMQRKKIMVEFTDPNPFKEFHIGHLYSNIVGESICRLLEADGAVVKRANYQGDVGMHVAKAVYGIIHHVILKPKAEESRSFANAQDDIKSLDKKPLEDKVKFLGKAYALGNKAYEENEQAKKEINELNKKIYDQDPEVMEIYTKGRQWSLDYFEEIYKRLGTKFDRYYFESEVGKIGLEFVKKHIGKVFKEDQGAVVFPGKDHGLHHRVFINSLGLPTYEAKELGLAPTKYKDFAYDLSVIITGNEIIEYFKVLLKALSLINPDLAKKTRHIPHGMVRLPQGKMSSRSGSVVTADWLLDEVKHRIKSAFPEMDEEMAEKVTVGAVKYAFLKSSIGRDIAFSFDESISLEGNSGPYIQYTYARTQSVLAKSKLKTQKSKLQLKSQNYKLELEELSLLRTIHQFPEIVEGAAENFAPNLLCNYLFDLAQKFNLFYQKHKILEGDNREFRLVLTTAVGQILKNGLHLLGIAAPDRM